MVCWVYKSPLDVLAYHRWPLSSRPKGGAVPPNRLMAPVEMEVVKRKAMVAACMLKREMRKATAASSEP